MCFCDVGWSRHSICVMDGIVAHKTRVVAFSINACIRFTSLPFCGKRTQMAKHPNDTEGDPQEDPIGSKGTSCPQLPLAIFMGLQGAGKRYDALMMTLHRVSGIITIIA